MLNFCKDLEVRHKLGLAFRALRNVGILGLLPACHQLLLSDEVVTGCVLTADLGVDVDVIQDERDGLRIIGV